MRLWNFPLTETCVLLITKTNNHYLDSVETRKQRKFPIIENFTGYYKFGVTKLY